MEKLISAVTDFLITLPVILIALSVHELCHGYAAYCLGDSTAKHMGRLSMNPLHHIDPIGFLCLIFFKVGWAKPVSVDTRFFKNPKRDMALCALAGPASNFALAFLFSFAYVFTIKIGIDNGYYWNETAGAFQVIYQMIGYMVSINLGLAVFNLIPIPPLDGSKILYAFLPNHLLYRILSYERYIQLGMFVLLWFGVLSGPINTVVMFFFQLFMNIAGGVIL